MCLKVKWNTIFWKVCISWLKTTRRQVNNAIIQQYVISYSLWNVLACKYNIYRVPYVAQQLHNIINYYGLIFATCTVYNATEKYSAALIFKCVCRGCMRVCVHIHVCVSIKPAAQTQAEAHCHITYKFLHYTFIHSTWILLRYAMSRSYIEMQHWTLKAIYLIYNRFTALAHPHHLNFWNHTSVEQNMVVLFIIEKNKSFCLNDKDVGISQTGDVIHVAQYLLCLVTTYKGIAPCPYI